ncbi:hypothetical protein HMPREF3226_01218 [Prevotella corporis]|uniref:Uncharacterized protein n=1 Tax=Prevotella corporis TaxID=28128 RepID=A0A133Q996_9BACT|nr:hypothetical protein HMPREF3226_01218 [Prevotella corporis]
MRLKCSFHCSILFLLLLCKQLTTTEFILALRAAKLLKLFELTKKTLIFR